MQQLNSLNFVIEFIDYDNDINENNYSCKKHMQQLVIITKCHVSACSCYKNKAVH